MQHFSIYVRGAGELDGTYRDVAGSRVDIAVKRVLAGMGESRHGVRQVGLESRRAKLAKGQKLTIEVTRWE